MRQWRTLRCQWLPSFSCAIQPTFPVYLKLAEEEGIAIQSMHLGGLAGYFSTEIGPQNEIVHLLAYPSPDECERRRAALIRDER